MALTMQATRRLASYLRFVRSGPKPRGFAKMCGDKSAASAPKEGAAKLAAETKASATADEALGEGLEDLATGFKRFVKDSMKDGSKGHGFRGDHHHHHHHRRGRKGYIALAVAGAGAYALSRAYTTIPAGHVGVRHLFGNVREDVLPSGLHIINPLETVVPMSIKTQAVEYAGSVPSREGLMVDLSATVLYRLDPTQAATMYKTVGADYSEVCWLSLDSTIIPELKPQRWE
mmetsp:Transcript_15256/g.36233  ORF Transcript_15256/g.36233 Transcript_15256/m.36233 type:complete len:231 (+) Transcript_15256:80-772(+)